MARLTKNGVQQRSYEVDGDYRLALWKKKHNLKLQKINKKERIAYFKRQRELNNDFEMAMQND